VSINVDITSARAVNDRLPTIVNQVVNTKHTLSGLRLSIDTRVLDRSNLRTRLRNAQINIESIENDLLLFHRIVAQNLISYEDNEARLSDMARSVSIKQGK